MVMPCLVLFWGSFCGLSRKELSAKQRIAFMLLCVGFGYLLGPEITSRTQFISSDATASMLAAIFNLHPDQIA